ncbi:MAG TPA: glycosyltransferase family 2 protein [Patescibacteria group bacterium]
MPKKPKVGIITVNYNNYEDTANCVTSLGVLDSSLTDNHIYVVDNGSGKTVLQKIKKIKKIILISSKENLGFAGGNNLGIKKALADGCDYVFLINNDAMVTDPETIYKLVLKNKGISAPVVKFQRGGEDVFDYGGRVDKVFGRNTHYESPFLLDDFYPTADYYSGVCLLINSKVFKKVGYLDESYFLYYEDADFCLKAKSAGYKLTLCPEVTILHKLSSSTNKLGGKKVRILADSHFRFCLNNLPPTATPFFIAFNIYLRLRGASS